MPATQTRIVGSGYTTLEYAGKRIAFLDSFRDSGQQPITAAVPVHPLDAPFPVEIATATALNAGTIQATIRELWNEPVWYQLQGLAGKKSITDVWAALRENPMRVICRMVIRPPGGAPVRGKTYHNCTVTSIPDDEDVTIGALTVPRTISIMYTHSTAL